MHFSSARKCSKISKYFTIVMVNILLQTKLNEKEVICNKKYLIKNLNIRKI